MSVAHCYRPVVIEALAAHGVRPTPATPPALVQEFVSDLYRFELRRLRARQVGGEIPRTAYAEHVIALRRRYLLVSLPLRHWTIAADQDGAAADQESAAARGRAAEPAAAMAGSRAAGRGR